MKIKKMSRDIRLTLAFAVGLSMLLSVLSANAFAAQPDMKLQITSGAVVLMDGDTGQILFEKNMHEKLHPASITKVMTALIALERGGLKDTLTMSYDAVFSIGRDTSHIALDVGERLTLEQALYALSIASANDAANGIAELISGSIEDFATQMTVKAKELGAINTNFMNPHGLPDDNHYTTAHDMARITAAAIKIPEFINIFGAVSYDMPPTNIQQEARSFNRKNSLLTGEYKYADVVAEKTGWTPSAEYTYVAVARRSERTLVAIVMKSPTEAARWEDTAALFEYGFNELMPIGFDVKEFSKEQYVVECADGAKIDTKLIPVESFNCLIPKSLNKKDIEIKYIMATDGIDGNIEGKAVFLLKPESASSVSMFTELGDVNLEIHLAELAAPENKTLAGDGTAVSGKQDGQQEKTENKSSVFSTIFTKILPKFLEIVGGITVILLLLVMSLYIRRNIIIKRRRRNRLNYRNMYRRD